MTPSILSYIVRRTPYDPNLFRHVPGGSDGRGPRPLRPEWHLDPDQYREFIETVTGIAPPDEPTASDCYRIGNRIEAFVEEHHRLDEWTPDLVEEYPDVDSLAEILGLARFFRRCHDCRVDGA